MKRIFSKEILLFSAPLLLLFGGLIYGKWQRRGETPQIALNIKFKSQPRAFDWQASMQGGPKPNYKLGWNEKIVAFTPRGKQIIWNNDRAFQGRSVRAIAGSEGRGGVSTTMSTRTKRYQLDVYRHSELEFDMLPMDTKRLEWQVEVAAIPSDDSEIWQSPLDSRTLTSWSLVTGSAHLTRKFPIRYDASASDTIIIKRTPLKQKSVAELKMLLRRGNRRSFRRLVAYDGKTTRTLWTDTDSLSSFCHSAGSGGGGLGYDGESLSFDMSQVKASMGEIVFLYDTVYDINNRAGKVRPPFQWLDAKSLNAFEKSTGGVRFSKRLVLRSKP